MANTDGPNGLVPKYNQGDTPPINRFAPNGYSIASGASAIYEGDLVKTTATADAHGRPGIAVGAATDVFRGVFQGCEYTLDGERRWSNYWPANSGATDIVAYVYDDPLTIFSIQADEDIVAADINNKADIIAGAGSTATGMSGFELDSSNIGSGDNLLIVALDPVEGNAIGENFSRVLVLIREHEIAAAGALYTAR